MCIDAYYTSIEALKSIVKNLSIERKHTVFELLTKQ